MIDVPNPAALETEELETLVGHLRHAAGSRLLILVCRVEQEAPALAWVAAALLDAGKRREEVHLDPYATPLGPLHAVDEATLLAEVFDPLTTGEVVTQAGCWVVVHGSRGGAQDDDAWQALFARLNLARNTVMRRLGGPLLMVLSPEIFTWLARGAPDLYSIRSAVVRLDDPAPAPELGPPLRLRSLSEEPPQRGLASSGAARSRESTLEALLLDLFDEDELRQFLRSLPDGKPISHVIPGRGAPLAMLAHAAVGALDRRGRLDAPFFSALLAERPKAQDAIVQIAAAFGVAPQTPSPPVARETVAPTLSWSPSPLESEEAALILASYNPDEVLPGRHPDLRLFLPAEAQDRAGWEAQAWPALRQLRQALIAQGRRRLRIHAPCVPGLAIRAGAVFHRASGFEVSVTQRDESTGRQGVWALDGPASPAPLRVDRREDEGLIGPDEVHLLVSATQDVFPMWSRWRFDHPEPAVMLHARPPTGPARDAVQGAPAARDLARAISDLALEERSKHPDLPLRIFYAGPNGLAVALGRSLNALSEIILMDFDKYAGRYVASFRFRPG